MFLFQTWKITLNILLRNENDLPFQFVFAFALLSAVTAARSNISVVATFSEVFTQVCTSTLSLP